MVGFQRHDNLTSRQKFIAGISSGVITRFLTQPLDILKLRTQVQKSKNARKVGAVRMIKKIWYEEGYKAFFHGHVLGQIHSISAVGTQFWVYEMATQFFSKYSWYYSYKHECRFVCGVLAGSAAAVLVTPIEVIRIRQMLVKDQYSSLWYGAKSVYKLGGFFAFYEGLSAGILQLGPQVGINFTVFNAIQHPILRLMNKNISVEDQKAHRYSAQSIVLSSTIAGSISGIVSKICTYPLDLAKRRLQIGSHRHSSKVKVPSTSKHLIQCKGLVDCISRTVRKEGFRGLFKGLTVTVGKASVSSVIAFTAYEMICHVLRESNRVIS